MNKVTGRLNADYKLTNNLETGTRVNFTYTEGNDVPMQSLYYVNPIFAGMMILPWTPAYDDEGKHNAKIAENSNSNPRATAEYDDQFSKSYQMLGNIYLQWNPISKLRVEDHQRHRDHQQRRTQVLVAGDKQWRRYVAGEHAELRAVNHVEHRHLQRCVL